MRNATNHESTRVSELDSDQQDSAQVAALAASQVHPESALPSRPDYAAPVVAVSPSDAKGKADGAGLEYRTCCDHPDCTTCAGREGFYRIGATGKADAANAIRQALKGEIPLVEPVYIGKALRAGGEAQVCLSGGTGPLACVMLVNIQLTPWIHTEDTAKAFADGYNRALRDLRSAVLEVVEQDQSPATSAAATYPTFQHPDDAAIDRFAIAMKAKMAASRAKGRNGWDNEVLCPAERLQAMLVDHIAKGDPVDVGNFAMMLFNRGERTATSAADAQDAERKPLAHGHREDWYLMANARRVAEKPIHAIRTMPNWVLASELFATGCTAAHEICRDAGIDPDGYRIQSAAMAASRNAAGGQHE